MGGGRGTTFVYFKNTYCSIEILGNTIKIERRHGCAARIKFRDGFQIKIGFCIHDSSVVD